MSQSLIEVLASFCDHYLGFFSVFPGIRKLLFWGKHAGIPKKPPHKTENKRPVGKLATTFLNDPQTVWDFSATKRLEVGPCHQNHQTWKWYRDSSRSQSSSRYSTLKKIHNTPQRTMEGASDMGGGSKKQWYLIVTVVTWGSNGEAQLLEMKHHPTEVATLIGSRGSDSISLFGRKQV